MTILQSLLKFKKDLKSGTPVVVGNDRVVCVIGAIEPDSCTNARPVRVHFSAWMKKACRKNIFSFVSLHTHTHTHTHTHENDNLKKSKRKNHKNSVYILKYSNLP
jgi:hypothetical protein